MNKEDITLDGFLQFFPEVELPITISQDSISEFSKRNKPLSNVALQEFIYAWDEDQSDLAEYIPCCRLSKKENYHAIIYWKADLNKYEYYLVTLSKTGNLINRKTIASTLVEDNVVKQSLARITEDEVIHIIAGANINDDHDYDPNLSKSFSMELLPSGEVIFEV